MDKSKLAQSIIALRKSKGFSQEKLAENASINLRTLQRIENGKTEPRGETLNLIARALDVPIEQFSNIAAEDDTEFLQFMNLSALSFWIIPFGNIILPFAFWYIKKNKAQETRKLGSRIINFQITWSVVTVVFFLVCTVGGMVNPGNMPFYLMILPGMVLLYLLNSVQILLTAVRIKKDSDNSCVPFTRSIIH